MRLSSTKMRGRKLKINRKNSDSYHKRYDTDVELKDTQEKSFSIFIATHGDDDGCSFGLYADVNSSGS